MTDYSAVTSGDGVVMKQSGALFRDGDEGSRVLFCCILVTVRKVMRVIVSWNYDVDCRR